MLAQPSCGYGETCTLVLWVLVVLDTSTLYFYFLIGFGLERDVNLLNTGPGLGRFPSRMEEAYNSLHSATTCTLFFTMNMCHLF